MASKGFGKPFMRYYLPPRPEDMYQQYKHSVEKEKMAHKYTDQIELDIDDDMPFGKFVGSGKTVREVLADDPGYLRWIANTSSMYSLSDEVEEALDDERIRLSLIEGL